MPGWVHKMCVGIAGIYLMCLGVGEIMQVTESTPQNPYIFYTIGGICVLWGSLLIGKLMHDTLHLPKKFRRLFRKKKKIVPEMTENTEDIVEVLPETEKPEKEEIKKTRKKKVMTTLAGTSIKIEKSTDKEETSESKEDRSRKEKKKKKGDVVELMMK